MNIRSSLVAELREKAYRDAYVASQIRVGLPFQVRALRQSRELTQGGLAELAGMSQPRIAEIEKPGKRKFNLDTLLRIASALDVGLEVRFVPISTIIDHTESFDPDAFRIPTFTEELEEAEREEIAARARAKHFGAIRNEVIGSPLTLVASNYDARQMTSHADQLGLKFQELRLAASKTPVDVPPRLYSLPPQDPNGHEQANPWKEAMNG